MVSEDIIRQVKGPATGLIVTAILNWVAIPLVMLISVFIVNVSATPPHWVLLVPLSALVLSSFMLIAGLTMKRLQAYGLAIVGSILAILVTPGNLIGLPIGIWALVVLGQRRVREAFGKGPIMPPLEPARPANGSGAWKVAAVIVAAVMLIIAIPVGAIFLAMLMPAYQRARDHAGVVQPQITHPTPTFVVRGTVTDATTGQPIAGARVDDNSYGAGPNRPPQQAWTDAQGHYELRTWAEEHTLAASAPAYQTKMLTLLTTQGLRLQQDGKVQMDFQLQPAENSPAKP